MTIEDCLHQMRDIYNADPKKAVRGQRFIKILHRYIIEEFERNLTSKAKSAGVQVVPEAHIFGSFAAKDVDVAVIHPVNGPLITVGVRSQMSSIGKNAHNYYQDIIGECISLQERYPLTVMGYAYLHPLESMSGQPEKPNHDRWANLYSSIGSRDSKLYRYETGSYDEFAYLVVDFKSQNCDLKDDIVRKACPGVDMSICTLVPRLIEDFKKRSIVLEELNGYFC